LAKKCGSHSMLLRGASAYTPALTGYRADWYGIIRVFRLTSQYYRTYAVRDWERQRLSQGFHFLAAVGHKCGRQQPKKRSWSANALGYPRRVPGDLPPSRRPRNSCQYYRT